jgi:hypothetical protein
VRFVPGPKWGRIGLAVVLAGMVPAVLSNSVVILGQLAGVYQSLRPVHLMFRHAGSPCDGCPVHGWRPLRRPGGKPQSTHHATPTARTNRRRVDAGSHQGARARRARAPRHHHHRRRHPRATALKLFKRPSGRTSENSRYRKFVRRKASSTVIAPFERLQFPHVTARFVQSLRPPRLSGIIWST